MSLSLVTLCFINSLIKLCLVFFIWTFKQIWLRCHFMITRKTASADKSHGMWSKAPEQLLKRLLINKFFRNCSFFPFLFSYRSPFLHVLHIIILTKAGTGNKRQMSLIKCTEAYKANTMCCWEKKQRTQVRKAVTIRTMRTKKIAHNSWPHGWLKLLINWLTALLHLYGKKCPPS